MDPGITQALENTNLLDDLIEYFKAIEDWTPSPDKKCCTKLGNLYYEYDAHQLKISTKGRLTVQIIEVRLLVHSPRRASLPL